MSNKKKKQTPRFGREAALNMLRNQREFTLTTAIPIEESHPEKAAQILRRIKAEV